MTKVRGFHGVGASKAALFLALGLFGQFQAWARAGGGDEYGGSSSNSGSSSESRRESSRSSDWGSRTSPSRTSSPTYQTPSLQPQSGSDEEMLSYEEKKALEQERVRQIDSIARDHALQKSFSALRQRAEERVSRLQAFSRRDTAAWAAAVRKEWIVVLDSVWQVKRKNDLNRWTALPLCSTGIFDRSEVPVEALMSELSETLDFAKEAGFINSAIERQVLKRMSDSLMAQEPVFATCDSLLTANQNRIRAEQARAQNIGAGFEAVLIGAFGVMVVGLGFFLYRSQQENQDNAYAFVPMLPQADPVFANHFQQIQSAWSQGQLKPVAYTLGDGQLMTFQCGLDLNAAKHLSNTVTDVNVLSSQVLDKTTVAGWEIQPIQFGASVIDRYFNVKTRELVKDHSGMFQEIWTYARRIPNGKTESRFDFDATHCSQCGHPVDMQVSPVCPACKSSRRSGYCGWVLVKIAQLSASSWGTNHAAKEIRISEQESVASTLMENRACALFWRFASARLIAPSRDIRKAFTGLVTADFDWEKALAIPMVAEGFAVGDVQFWGVQQATAEATSRTEVRIDLNILFSFEEPHGSKVHKKAFITLSRAHAGGDLRLDTISCTGCGAARGSEVSCEYCGELWPSEEYEWLMAELY